MATWASLSADLRRSGTAKEFSSELFEMSIPTSDGRTQTVQLRPMALGQDEWLEMLSAFELVTPATDLLKYLRKTTLFPCGGLAVVNVNGDELLAVRHAIPLATMDPGDFSKPIKAVAIIADILEQDTDHGNVDIF